MAESVRKMNLDVVKSLAELDSFEFSHLERSALSYFALIMFADLKTYHFYSKFILLNPE
jgi:hypothetical protein